MKQRLFVGVLGNRNSGKSITWNTLFGQTVKTGTRTRTLKLYDGQCVDVFLVSGSFEERNKYAGEILDNQDCKIVLCSIQYTEAVRTTLDYVVERDFEMFVQWLNPGWMDAGESIDRLGLVPWLLDHGATVSKRNSKINLDERTQDIRQFIHGWSKRRGLTYACP